MGMPKKKSVQVQANYPSQVWTQERMDTVCCKPWDNHTWSLEQKATGLVREMIAGLYALHYEHIEFCFGYTGWPSDPSVWHALEKERNECVGMDELPPDQDNIPTRYGVTYSIARLEFEQRWPHRDGAPNVWDEQWLERLFQEWVGYHLVNGRSVKGRRYPAEIPKLLIEHGHSQECRSAMFQAMRLLDDFKMGSGGAKELTAKLRREEPGGRAIEMTEQRLIELRATMKDLLDQPFDIERDYAHLAQDFSYSLNAALMVKSDVFISSFHFDWIREPNPIQDTRGSDPGDSLARLRPPWNESDSATELIDLWCTAYLGRLADFTHRWTSSHQLPTQLKGLSEHIARWQIHPSIEKDYELLGLRPVEREAVDRVKRRTCEAIVALLHKLPTTAPPVTFAALWGEQREQQVRLALKEMDMLHPPAAKGKGRYVAVMHAACDHFEKHPKYLKDWPVALANFFPDRKWSEKNTPKALIDADKVYQGAYKNMRLLLNK